VIPKGTYPGVDHDVKTVATGTIFGCLEDMDENLVYQITKLIIEKRSDLVNVHKEARNISLENAVVGSPIPYHPGAIRYYKEKGANIQQ
jgi:TRAP transporter TAXI family solute receptor